MNDPTAANRPWWRRLIAYAEFAVPLALILGWITGMSNLDFALLIFASAMFAAQAVLREKR